MDIIDSHVHIGRDFRAQNKSRGDSQNTAQLNSHLNLNGISLALIFPFPSPAESLSNQQSPWYTLENEEIRYICSRSSGKMIECIAVHPKDNEHFKEILTENTKAVKVHTRATRTDPRDLIGHPLMKILKEHSLPLILHVGTGFEEELVSNGKDISLESAFELAKAEQDVTFLLAHLGRLNKKIYQALELPNVFMDTSGISLIASAPKQFYAKHSLRFKNASRVIEDLVIRGYSSRIVWGSDEPYGSSYKEELRCILKAEIPERDRALILSGNARKIFRLFSNRSQT